VGKFTIIAGIALVIIWLVVFLPLQIRNEKTEPKNSTSEPASVTPSIAPIPRENIQKLEPTSETSSVKLLPTNEGQISSPSPSTSSQPVEVTP
jgi:cytoskeletal protein RodZ